MNNYLTARRFRWLTVALLLAAATGAVRAANCTSAPAGLIGWWPGEGNANDIIGTNNGTLQGGATATNAGLDGACFKFDGTNGYVSIPDAPVLRPTNLTVEAWVLFTSLNSHASNPGHQYIVFKQNSRGNQSNFEGFGLGKDRYPNVTNRNGDVLYFNVSDVNGTIYEVDSSILVQTGIWYHVAGVRGTNFLQLYVNGQFQGQVSVTVPQDYGNYPLYFGTTGQPTFFDGKLAGELDEVSLYNRALSSNEIVAIYNAGAAGKCNQSPSITTPPAAVSVSVSNSATFTVGVSGNAPLVYQWRFNATNAVGLNTNSLTLTNVQDAAAGYYSVLVTNPAGSVLSPPAGLTVLNNPSNPPPVLSISMNAGFASLNLGGTTNQTYGIQHSTDLSHWRGLTNILLTTPQQFWNDYQSATQQMQYYRLVNGAIPLP